MEIVVVKLAFSYTFLGLMMTNGGSKHVAIL
jgi:hypothetical protein